MDKQFLNIFQKIGTNDLSKNDFVLSCFEEVMSPHWPQPKSEYHCRVCNYEEFATEEALDTHITSAHHVILKKSYSLSFCLACQLHCVDAKGIAEHRKQPKHKLLDKLFQDLKSEAVTYWKEQQQQQFHNVKIENVQKLTSICSVKIKQNDTIDNQPTKSHHVCKTESKSSRINPESKFKNTTTKRTGKEAEIEKANVKKPVPAIVSMINQQIKGNNKQAKPEQLIPKTVPKAGPSNLAKLEVQKEKAKKLVPKVVAVMNQQIKEGDKLVKSEIQKTEAKKSVSKVVSAIDKQSKEKKPGKLENIKDKVEKTVPNVVSTINQQIKKTNKTSKISSASKSVEAQTQRKRKQKSSMKSLIQKHKDKYPYRYQPYPKSNANIDYYGDYGSNNYYQSYMPYTCNMYEQTVSMNYNHYNNYTEDYSRFDEARGNMTWNNPYQYMEPNAQQLYCRMYRPF